jgi:hypothetical protein
MNGSTGALRAYLDLEGSGVLPAGAEGAGRELDESSRKRCGSDVRGGRARGAPRALRLRPRASPWIYGIHARLAAPKREMKNAVPDRSLREVKPS